MTIQVGSLSQSIGYRTLEGARVFLALCAMLGLAGMAATGRAQDFAPALSEGILKATGGVIAHLTQNGYRHVGVLKFRTRIGGGELSTHVGSINSVVATRLESALALLRDKDMDFVLLADASRTAADLPGASVLTPAGLDVLFSGDYRPAWKLPDGRAALKADAFVTGVIDVDEQGTRADVGLLCYHKGAGAPEILEGFSVALTPGDMVPLGRSFATRGAFGPGLANDDFFKRLQSASDEADGADTDRPNVFLPISNVENLPIFSPEPTLPNEFLLNGPVGLVVTYDGNSVPIEVRGGKLSIREPDEGQAVRISVEKKNKTDGKRLGIVVKVNGENTTKAGERMADVICWKWVLSDATPKTVIRGLYDPLAKEVVPFRVASLAESLSKEYDFGDACGQISVSVFNEKATEAVAGADASEKSLSRPNAVANSNDAKRTDVLDDTIPIPLNDPASDPSDLKQRLLALATKPPQPRGLVVADGKAQHARLVEEKFEPEKEAVWAVVLQYYEASENGATAAAGEGGK